MTKVLIHSPDFPPMPGGIATMARGLARGFVEAGCKVTVTAPEGRPEDFDFVRLKTHKAFIVNYHLQSLQTKLLISRFQPDLIVSTRWHHSGLVCERFKKKARHIAYMIGAELEDRHLRQEKWKKKFEQLLLRADYVASISEDTHERTLKKSGIGNGGPVHIGVDLDAFKPKDVPEGERKSLVSICRLIPNKGIQDAIRVFARLADEFPWLRYQILGEGPHRPELEKLVLELGLANRVGLAGFQPEPEMIRRLQNCLFTLFPSYYEGFGLAAIEALACARTVVGYRSGGLVSAVRDNVDGVLCETGNMEELYHAIRSLIQDPDKRKALEQAGFERAVKDYGWKNVALRLLEKVT